MARGYRFDDEDLEASRPPSRPARRSDSRRVHSPEARDNYGSSGRGEYNYGYSSEATHTQTRSSYRESRSTVKKPANYTGGHYAESPIVMPEGSERNLNIVRSSSDHELAPRGGGGGGGGGGQGYRPHSYNNGGKSLVTRTASDGPVTEAIISPPRRSRSTTLNRNGNRQHYGGRSRSNSRPRPPGSYADRSNGYGPTTVSKVTRSKSLSSRPAGIAVHHAPHHHRGGNSEIYPVQTMSRPGTRMSSKSGLTSGPHNSTKAGVVIETMSAPNPFCPNTRGVCCLMVLVNLALILVAIGFIIVLQLPEPAIVWNLGIVILVFGFFTFFVALLYCMCICQEAAYYRQNQHRNGELYWTHHWQKNITIPELKTKGETQRWAEQDRFPEDEHSDTSSSRDYPRLYLESEYATEREADFETDKEGAGDRNRAKYNVEKDGGVGGGYNHERDRH